MKIEKVNDSQIRCTLTREDLASRKLKISELAYGTPKAKSLFRDMMEMANFEYGFEADNIPLMIEAIPVNSGCIVLIITKVEDPDELDTRFSQFAPSLDDDDDEDGPDFDDDESASFGNMLNSIRDALDDEIPSLENKTPISHSDIKGMAFTFTSMKDVITVSSRAYSTFTGSSSLYRSLDGGEYLLVLRRDGMDALDFVQICNLMSEYGLKGQGNRISEAYLSEHYESICREDAIITLGALQSL